MNKLTILILSLIFTFRLTLGQNKIKQFIKENTYEIKSINPLDTNFRDLNIIGKAIGSARIVMLGEQDHGDAPAFQAKARLIRYLHEKLGFNVIAFESDFYGLYQGWQKTLNKSSTIEAFMEQNIYQVWTRCEECSAVFNYIKSTNNKTNRLIVTGFDNQMSGEYSQQNFKKEINQFLLASNIPFVKQTEYTNEFIPFIDSILYLSRYQDDSKSERIFQKAITQIDTILNQLKNKDINSRFWITTIESLKSECFYILSLKEQNFIEALTTRDKQMAANLTWLLKDKYPQQKVIIWAANAHITKYALDSTYPQTMGYYFTQQPMFTNNTYVLGFTSYSGTTGRVYSNPYQIIRPQKESAEEWINQKRYAFAFVNFHEITNGKTEYDKLFLMRGQDHYQMKANWTKLFDGIFFIKVMYPCSIKK